MEDHLGTKISDMPPRISTPPVAQLPDLPSLEFIGYHLPMHATLDGSKAPFAILE